MQRLFDFASAEDIARWSPLDDVVMGGRSSSRVVDCDDYLRFEGNVSLEQGGGFASMQADVDLDLTDATGLRLRVRGDGQTYKLGLYDERGRRRIAYRFSFESSDGSWTEISVPFDKLEPRFRGRDVPDADPIDLSTVRGMSLLISDEQAGPFGIDVAWIEAVTMR
jgi:monofunctional biosynthetic peptidoglycan transglycosylase